MADCRRRSPTSRKESMNRFRFALVVCLCILGLAAAGWAQERPTSSAQKLIVGVKEAPPFAIKQADNTWSGLSIELWQAIAMDLQLSYTWRELDLSGLLQGVADGSLDVGVAALTITPEREKLFDFTQPFYITGLGIAVPAQPASGRFIVARRVFSRPFLEIVAFLGLLLLGVGTLIWLCEHRHNAHQFGGGVFHGLRAGVWWAAATMTTVGYGDKSPTTTAGQVVGLLWMFTSLIVVAGVIASMTAALTVAEMTPRVRGPERLAEIRVGTVPTSTSEAYLRTHRLPYHAYATVLDGLRALAAGDLDAMVYDAPLLRYLVAKEFPARVTVLPHTFERQYYGIALPTGSPWREKIDYVLLEKIRQPAWRDLLYRYLGQDDQG